MVGDLKLKSGGKTELIRLKDHVRVPSIFMIGTLMCKQLSIPVHSLNVG